MWPTGQTQVNRVQARVRGAAETRADSNTVRSLANRFLEHADFRPPSLPPQAVLVVRRLRDPMPGRWVTDGPIARLHPDWEAAVRRQLGTLVETAARPDRGWIAGNPEAIVFADSSELFACLALAMTGSEKDHWWCLALLKSLRISADGLTALLAANPRELPAVVSCLAEWRRIDSVIGALGEHQIRTNLIQLLRVHGLPADFLSRDATAPFAIDTDQRRTLLEERRRRGSGRPHLHMAGLWPARVRAIVARAWPLAKGAEALLGIGLSLHAEPSLPQTRSFTEDLERWWNEDPPDSPTDAHGTTSSRPQIRKAFGEGTNRVLGVLPLRSQPARPVNPTNPDEPISAETSAEIVEPSAQSSNDDPASPVRASGTFRPNPRFAPAPEQAGPMAEADTNPVWQPASAASPGAATEGSSHSSPPRAEKPGSGIAGHPAAWANGTGVKTQWGGVFYLINLMSHLHLPECFEAAGRLESTVGAWGTLELLARGLCGRDGQEHDPIWELLAGLSGRESNTLPGMLFPSMTEFRLPTAWIESWPEPWPSCQWSEQSGRLRIESAGGFRFIVADIPRTADSADAQAAQEWAGTMTGVADGSELPRLQPGNACLPPVPSDATVLPGLNHHLRRWMDWALPFIRFRLAKALGDEPSCDLRPVLFERAARVFVTRAHIDVVLALQGISLPVRRAGLDRDPGWCPGFGRVVQFHFE